MVVATATTKAAIAMVDVANMNDRHKKIPTEKPGFFVVFASAVFTSQADKQKAAALLLWRPIR